MTLLKTWAQTIKCFIAKFYDKKGNLLNHVILEEGLVQNFVQILCIQIPTAKQINDCVISTSGFTDFDNICNDIKSIIMKSLNTITLFIFDTRTDADITSSKFYSFLLTGLPLIISTLIKFCKHESVDLDVALNVKIIYSPNHFIT